MSDHIMSNISMIALSLALLTEIAGYRFFRYYPFRNHLRIPIWELVVLMGMVFSVELWSVGQASYHERQLFFSFFSELYMTFEVIYFLLSVAVIKVSLVRQAFMFFPLCAWTFMGISVARLFEREFHTLLGLPEWVLFAAMLLLVLIIFVWPAFVFCRRIEPYLLQRKPMAEVVWRWGWVPAMSFLVVNIVYARHQINGVTVEWLQHGMAFGRTIGFIAIIFYVYICLRAFEIWHQKTMSLQQSRFAAEAINARAEQQYQADLMDERTRKIIDGIGWWLKRLREAGEARDEQRAEKYLAQEERRLEEAVVPEHLTRQEIVDTLLRYGLGAARDADIRAEMSVHLERKIALSDTDICALFGNVLENAVHACQKLPRPQRWMSIHINELGGCVVVAMDNSCDDETVHERAGIFYSDEDGSLLPGIGTASMREIVERADGRIDFMYGNGQFSVSMMLPVEDEDSDRR